MKKTYKVELLSAGMRIDRWIRNNIAKIPQSLIEKNLRNGKIKLNHKKVKSSYKIKASDQIDLYSLNFKTSILQKKNKFNPSNHIIKENEETIIDDNENFIVLNKTSGVSVQGGTKSKRNLIDIFSKSKFFKDTKPYSVHRLDKDTSGVFIIAKNREYAQLFTSLFRLRKIHKTYLAICHGEILSKSGEWNNNLKRYDNDKLVVENAKTIFKVLDYNSISSLVMMKPITGRKHQLRKQLSLIGNPIYGDRKYNFNKFEKSFNKNLMLHSYQIKFMINKRKYTYTALLPDYFTKLMKAKRLRLLNY
tara:strand:+ start:333 stop:1247 length:915 start_codon:yes stop_codon:yes gene_type:complete